MPTTSLFQLVKSRPVHHLLLSIILHVVLFSSLSQVACSYSKVTYSTETHFHHLMNAASNHVTRTTSSSQPNYRVNTLVGNTALGNDDILTMFDKKVAYLKSPCGICLGLDDDLYVSDCGRHVIFRIFKNGSMIVLGGLGSAGINNDGYDVKQTLFDTPSAVSVAPNGDLFVADSNNNKIRIVSASTGLVSSIADTFNKPLGVVVSSNNVVYIADTGNNVIKKFDISTQTISTIGGKGYLDGSYDNVDANSIILYSPKNIHVVSNGKQDTVYFTDNERVKSIDPNGKYRIVDGLVPQSNLYGIFVTSANEIWTSSSSSHFLQMKSIGSATQSTLIGQQDTFGYEGDDLTDSYSKVKFYNPSSLVVKNSIIYLTDTTNNCIRKIDLINKIVSTFSGGIINHPFGENIQPIETSPSSIITNPFIFKNELYFVERYSTINILRKLSNDGTIKTILGSASQLQIENLPTRRSLSFNSLFAFPNGDCIIGGSSLILFNIETNLFTTISNNSVSNVIGIGNSFSNGILVGIYNLGVDVYRNGQPTSYTSLISEFCFVNQNGNYSIYYFASASSNTISKTNLEFSNIETVITSDSSFTSIACENDKIYVLQSSLLYEIVDSKLVRVSGSNYNNSGSSLSMNGYNGENIPSNSSLLQGGSIRLFNGTFYNYGTNSYITKISNGLTQTIVGINPKRKTSKFSAFARDNSRNLIYYLDRFTLKMYNETSGVITSLTDSISTSATILNPSFFSTTSTSPMKVVYSSFDNSILIVDSCSIIEFNLDKLKTTRIAGTKTCGNTIPDVLATETPIRLIHTRGFSVNPSNGDIYLVTTPNAQNSVFFKIEKSSGMIRSLFSSSGSTISSDGPVTNETWFGQVTGFYAVNEDSFYYSTSTLIRVIEKKDNGSYYLRTIVGNGVAGYSGDNLPALQSSLSSPKSLHVKKNGDIIILDGSYTIRKYVNSTGVLTLLAGNPNQNIDVFSGDLLGTDSKFLGLGYSINYNDKTEEIYFLDGDFKESGFSLTFTKSMLRKLNVACVGNAIFNSQNQTCECLSGYYGASCVALSCNGTLATYSSTCNGNGQCTDLNVCSCKQGFKGQYCEERVSTSNSLDNSTILIISITIPVVVAVIVLVILVIVIVVIAVCLVSKKKKNSREGKELATINTSNIELSDFPTGSTIISSSAGSVASNNEDAFSRYSNVVRIGQGAFGSVYKVNDLKQGNKIKAVKLVRFDSFTELNTIMKEASQLSNIKHPNILKVNDYFITNDNLLCIDMDYYESGDLTQFLKTECSETIVKQILKQSCNALNYVHSELSIIHRDIKPSNIFVKYLKNESIEIVIADFGLAKKYQEMKGQSYVGTPLYMSPEIALGSSYTFNTDIFSLGVSIYQIMTKDNNTSISNLLMGNQSESAQSILTQQMKQSSTQYSTELIQIVLQMLDKNSQTRPSAAQLLQLDFLK